MVADPHSLLVAGQNGQVDDDLILGCSCIVRATSIGTNIRFPAVLQLLAMQVAFYKLRKSVCSFFLLVFLCVFPTVASLQTRKHENPLTGWISASFTTQEKSLTVLLVSVSIELA